MNPYKGKGKFKQNNSQLRSITPIRKHWLIIPVLIVTSISWIYSIYQMTEMLGRHNRVFDLTDNWGMVLTLLVILTYGIVSTLLSIWFLLGKEDFYMDKNRVILSRSIFGMGRKLEFKPEELKNLRFQDKEYTLITYFHSWHRDDCGKIKFDVGHRTFSFGNTLYDSEASEYIGLIQEKLTSIKAGF